MEKSHFVGGETTLRGGLGGNLVRVGRHFVDPTFVNADWLREAKSSAPEVSEAELRDMVANAEKGIGMILLESIVGRVRAQALVAAFRKQEPAGLES